MIRLIVSMAAGVVLAWLVLDGTGFSSQRLSQSFQVLNIGTGVMNWSISTSTLSGGANWLQANPESDTPLYNAVPVVPISTQLLKPVKALKPLYG